MDPTVADIVMSLEYDAADVDYNAALGYRFWQWLSRLCGSGNTNQESAFDARTNDDPNKKPSRLLWIGTTSMKQPCVHGVEITCKRIIMANCVVGVAPFLP